MFFVALATDYDNTLAVHGVVDEETRKALETLKRSGRRAILVTGRELPDILEIFPQIELFDLVVTAIGNRDLAGVTAYAVNVAEDRFRAGFDISMQPDPYQPTDVSSFNQAGVPSLNFTTGAHTDYHKPSDTADKINYEDLERVADFATAITRRIMETEMAPQFTRVEQSAQTVSRTGTRIFTGTIPDYATEVKGLLLGGVVGGGHASDRRGLQRVRGW